MREPRDQKEAVKLLTTFHDREPRKFGAFPASLKIPSTICCVGEALYTYYQSDKWNRRRTNYKHQHEAGVLVHRTDSSEGEIVSVPSWIRDVETFVWLGYSLGYTYVDAEGDEVEALVRRPYPDLYAAPSGRALFIVERKSQLAAILWGGFLDVTSRGIAG